MAFSGIFLDYTIFIWKFRTDECAFYSWNVFSLQVRDIYKLQGGKAHYGYDYCYNLHFLSYEMFDQQLKITFRKFSATPIPSNKIHPPAFTHSPTKNSKSARLPPILPTLNIFRAFSAERVGGGGGGWQVENTMLSLVRMVSFLPILV